MNAFSLALEPDNINNKSGVLMTMPIRCPIQKRRTIGLNSCSGIPPVPRNTATQVTAITKVIAVATPTSLAISAGRSNARLNCSGPRNIAAMTT